MLRALIAGLLVLLAPLALAAQSPGPAVRIEEVGLQGYFDAAPLRVRVEVTNPFPRAEQFQVSVHFESEYQFEKEDTDTFSQEVRLEAHQRRSLELPLLLTGQRDRRILVVELRDSSGSLLASRQKAIKRDDSTLIAILCAQDAICQSVQTQITFSGTPEEQVDKGRKWDFVAVRQPPRIWWTYAGVAVVVVAMPLHTLSPEQRLALEGDVRLGGRMILLEQEAADPTFLAPYRSGPATLTPQVVGLGRLVRLPGLRSGQLGHVFSGDFPKKLFHSRPTDPRDWTSKRLSTAFIVPSLTWLLLWLAAYILAVGVINFAALTRLGRREWGWVTVTAIALLFTAGIYLTSAAKRPKRFGLDEVTTYWMDDRSSLAVAETSLRVSSPHRKVVTVSIPTEAVLTSGFGGGAWFHGPPTGLEGRLRQRKYHLRLGPPRQLELSLPQWSFHDLDFLDVIRLPGTVTNTEGRLRNETGLAFRQALYVDEENLYFVGPLAAGGEFNLEGAQRKPLRDVLGDKASRLYPNDLAETRGDFRYLDREEEEWQHLPQRPFELFELIRGWPRRNVHAFERRRGYFLGLAEQPSVGAELAEVPAERRQYILVVVSFAPSHD
jgi:hypothetical protein